MKFEEALKAARERGVIFKRQSDGHRRYMYRNENWGIILSGKLDQLYKSSPITHIDWTKGWERYIPEPEKRTFTTPNLENIHYMRYWKESILNIRCSG